MSTMLYSGINSTTFLRGYDPRTGVFDKTDLGMRYPERAYLHLPFSSHRIGEKLVIVGYRCIKYALKRAGLHGGLPLVVGAILEELVINDELEVIRNTNNKRRESRDITVEPGRIKVDSIFVVKEHITRVGAILEEIPYDSITPQQPSSPPPHSYQH